MGTIKETGIDSDLLLALEIADTIHDMVHPKKTNKRRCFIEDNNPNNPNDDNIYNLGIVTSVFSSMPKYKNLYKQKKDIIDIAILNNTKTYSELNKISNKYKVNDFEDVVVKLYNKVCENLSDKCGVLNNDIGIMRDYVPPKSELPSNNIINTIASIWDPILTSNNKKNYFKGQGDKTYTKVIGTTYVHLSNDSVKLLNGDDTSTQSVVLSFNFLLNRRNFKNSVNTLCTFASELEKLKITTAQGINSYGLFDPDLIDLVMKHFFQFNSKDINEIQNIINKKPNKKQNEIQNKKSSTDYVKYKIGLEFVKFLVSNNTVDTTSGDKYHDVLFKLFDIKRSGDYGQITAAKTYNDTNDIKCYLATGDRLCYLRAKLEGVNTILLKRNQLQSQTYTYFSKDIGSKSDDGKIKRMGDKINEINKLSSIIKLKLDKCDFKLNIRGNGEIIIKSNNDSDFINIYYNKINALLNSDIIINKELVVIKINEIKKKYEDEFYINESEIDKDLQFINLIGKYQTINSLEILYEK